MWSMIRGKYETLRSYLTRFIVAALESQVIRSTIKVDIFNCNLKHGTLLVKRPAQSWKELLF